MSVFGGDSWAPEAHHRKRRVDDLMIEGIESSVYKKLCNGKFVCVVCPNNPVFDSAIMLSTHVRSTRHGVAKLRRKDNDLAKQEAKKQLVLSDCVNAESAANASMKPLKTTNKPLIERARKAVSEVLSGEVSLPEVKPVKPATGNLVVPSIEDNGSNANPVGREATQNRVFLEVQPLSYRVSQERELKFTAAGWKRDCHGRWFKDENVEFDSDEEDPNIVLNEIT